MATTTRLLLFKPAGSDLATVVSCISDQMNAIDNSACKSLVTLEASPPVAEFTGQEWFTKDTKKFFYWTGSAWQQISLPSSGNAAAGRLAFNKPPLSSSNTFNTAANQENGPQLHAEVNVTNGNTYIVYASISVFGTATPPPSGFNDCFLRMRVSSGASVVTTAGTQFAQNNIGFGHIDSGFSPQSDRFMIGRWTANFTGAASFGVFLAKASGTEGTTAFERTSGSYQYIAVEEVS